MALLFWWPIPGKPGIGCSWPISAKADIGWQMERPEAQRPTLLAARVSQRRVRVTGLCRRRAKRALARPVGGFASPWRLPALHSPRGEGKKGKGGARASSHRAAERWLFEISIAWDAGYCWPNQIALAAIFTVKASSAALKMNETMPCTVTVRRMAREATVTSETCEVIPMTKEK
jgi:hypothetical protein